MRLVSRACNDETINQEEAMADTTTSPAKPVTDTSNKVNAALRYLASNATGGLAVFVALGTLSPEQQVELLKSANTIYNSSHDIVGAFANIWYIVFPIAGAYLAKIGINSSGFGAMMDKIFAAAKAGNVDAKVAIVNAAASPAIGTQAIVNPSLSPLAATAPNVVAAPELAPPPPPPVAPTAAAPAAAG